MRKGLLYLLLALPLLGLGQKSPIQSAGDVGMVLLPSAAFGASLYFEDDEGSMQYISAFATNTLITYALKWSIDKERPDGGHYAFPSGHTAAAFSGASFLQKRYGWQLGIPAYAIAGFVGYSRIYSKRHDLWDVLAGTAVGIGTTYLYTHPLEQGSLSIAPLSHGLLFAFRYEF